MREAYRRWATALAREHGRKRGWCRHHAYRLLGRLGGLREAEQINWGEARRLVFVCLGNRCRSPYAEARARSLGLEATSFGLAADASPAHPEAVRAARLRGLDLSRHRARAPFPPRPGDLLVAVEPAHLPRLRTQTAEAGAQVTLLGLWAQPARPHLEDPYGLSAGYFQTCFAVIDEAVESMAQRLREARR